MNYLVLTTFSVITYDECMLTGSDLEQLEDGWRPGLPTPQDSPHTLPIKVALHNHLDYILF